MEPSRTHHANQAVELSDLIGLKFSPHRYGTEMPRYVRVREPDGPSTDGGRKARQAIVLCAERDAGPDLMCGFVDVVKRTAELRSYAMVKQSFESRFNRELDITRGEYNRFLEALQAFLRVQSIETRVVNSGRGPTSGSTVPLPAPPSEGNTLPVLAIVLSGGFGFLICYLLMRFGLLH